MLFIQRRIVALFVVFSAISVCARHASAELVGVISHRTLTDSFLFEIDPTTGSADTANAKTIHTIGAGATTLSVNHITGIAFDPTSGVLYAHQNDSNTFLGSLYTVNIATGEAVRLGSTGRNITDLTFTPNGTLYGWVGGINDPEPGTGYLNDLVTLDVSVDGNNMTVVNTSYVGESGINTTNRAGLTSDASGNLYLKTGNESVPTNTPGNLYSINTTSGAGTLVSTVDGLATNSLSIDHDSGIAYTVDITASGTLLKTLSLTDGSLTDVGNMGALQVTAIAFNNSTAVPEPSSLALLSLLSMLPLASRMRNNRRGNRHSSGYLEKGSKTCLQNLKSKLAKTTSCTST